MKRILVLLLSVMTGYFASATGGTPGLFPPSPQMSCITPGQSVTDTITYINFTTLSGLTMDSLSIDSIANLPAGLTWTCSTPHHTFFAGDTGYIVIHGTTTAHQGQYRLDLYGRLKAGPITLPAYTNFTTLADLSYYLRVKCTNGGCVGVDTTLGKTNTYLPYSATCTIGASASITASGATSFCQGGSVTLSTAYDTAFTYRWSTGATGTSIVVTTSGSYSVTAYSSTDSSLATPVVVTVNNCRTPGFTPSPENLPCISSGQMVNDTIFFNSYSTIDTLTFDSINNLPAGLTWRTNKPNNTFTAYDSGWVLIQGTSTATSGQYRLAIIVSAVAAGLGHVNNIDLSRLSGQNYYVRMKCTSGSCLSVDTNLGRSAAFIPYTSACTQGAVAIVTAGGATTFCHGGSVMLTAGSLSGYTYQWSTGATTVSIIADSTATYTLTVYTAYDSAVSAPISVIADSCTTGSGGVAGLYPPADLMACIPLGQAVSDTLTFVNYTTLAGLNMDSLTIDSIANLPAGLTWSSSRPGNTFHSGDTGYIYIQGVNTGAAGQYRLDFFGSAAIGPVTLPAYSNLANTIGLNYYLRVACSNGSCTPVDTTNGKTHTFISNSCGATTTVTINSSLGSSFCAGAGTVTTLTASGPTGAGYSWSTGQTGSSISVNGSGVYSVTATYNGTATASQSIYITFNGPPTAFFTLQPDSAPHVWNILNQCNGNGALSYVWNWGDNSNPGTGATPSHTYDSAGNYTVCVSVTDTVGCTASYCDSSVYLFKNQSGQIIQLHVTQPALGISDVSGQAQQISYYSGEIHFSEAVTSGALLSLYDLSGRMVMSQNGFTGTTWPVRSSIAQGVYIIHLQNSSYSISKKVLIPE